MNSEPELIASQTTITNNCNPASISESLSDINQLKYDSIEKKAVHLRLILEKDFKAADLKWSLFVAAAFSFRYETCLRPFPPLFLQKGSKDMDALLSLITDVPALDLLLQRLDDLDNLVNICDIIDLLFFVLVRLREPNIKTVPHESHEAILNIVNSPSASSAPSSKPQYVFQIMSSPTSRAELQWKELAKNHRTFHAFYGGRLEHFYSILNLGFNKFLYKKTALGSGIYLSPELSTSLSCSLGGFGWGASCLGSHLCCVAICEVINAADGINYHNIPSSTQGDRKYLDDKSGAGENLESRSNYFVTNCELVRIRYLLVYAKQLSPRISSSGSIRDGGAAQQWIGRHKLFSVLLGYGLMLATIGFANNQPIQFYYQVLLKKLEVAINTMKA